MEELWIYVRFMSCFYRRDAWLNKAYFFLIWWFVGPSVLNSPTCRADHRESECADRDFGPCDSLRALPRFPLCRPSTQTSSKASSELVAGSCGWRKWLSLLLKVGVSAVFLKTDSRDIRVPFFCLYSCGFVSAECLSDALKAASVASWKSATNSWTRLTRAG